MKHRITLAPKLRFPEFNQDWKEETIGSFFDLDEQAEKAVTFERDKLLTVRLHTNGVVKNEKTTLTGGANYFKRGAGQFVFSKIDLLNGAFGIVPSELDGFASSSDVPGFSFAPDHSPSFFLSWLSSSYRRLGIERTGTSSTLKRVSPEAFFALEVLVPRANEQRKIAECLGTLDELISAESQKLDALEAHKKGLMQQLFPREGETAPRLRFPEFRDAPDWEEKTLGQLVDFQSGGTPSRINPELWNGSVPWISAKDMKQLWLEDAQDHISAAAIDEGAKLVPSGTVLMLVRGMTLLKDVPICVVRREMSFNQDVKALRPCDELDGLFLALLLMGAKDRLLKMVAVAGHGTGKLDTDELKAMALLLPGVGEQQRIASCLSSLDDLIAAKSGRIEALKVHKRGLMQQLFPSAAEAVE